MSDGRHYGDATRRSGQSPVIPPKTSVCRRKMSDTRPRPCLKRQLGAASTGDPTIGAADETRQAPKNGRRLTANACNTAARNVCTRPKEQ